MDDDAPQGPQLADLRKAPAERAAAAVLPVSVVTWAAADIMHLTGFPGALDVSIATALSAAVAWGASGHWRKVSRRLPAWIAVTGGWLALGAGYGPLTGWPYPAVTGAWAVASFIAWRKARRHPAVLEAQEWRQQRAEWLSRSRRWGLGGSHLLKFQKTRLGERYIVDTRGTGKRSSAIAAGHVAELIAEDDGNLPASRVRVRQHRFAGQVEISVRRKDPWEKPILHPVADDDPEVDLSGPYSIASAPGVGQDPETGRVLKVPLWDETGGKNIFILALKGGGKGVLLDNISERVTAAADAVQIRVNLSIKGPAEAERWGPACHLTAFGPHQKGRAVKVLTVVNMILEWRAQHYAKGQYDPSPADPLLVVIFDESDSAMAVPAIRKLTEDIATKGREYGASLVRAGQRGTADYGSAKIRSQDDVFCVGKVNRPGEVYHAAGSVGFELPDMASYGEGKPGVWAIAELGGGHQLGRTWILGDSRAAQAAAVARIAGERAFAQPELPAACREFLGESYEILLSTDVFAKWARDHAERESREFMAGRLRATPADPGRPAAQASPAVVAGDIEHLDFDMDIDPDARARLAEIDAKNKNTLRMITETAAMPKPPEVSPEALAAHTAARWRQIGDGAQIPAEARPVLLGLLREGTTIAAIAEALGVSKWTARTYLERLRNEGIARVDGKGRSARFRLTEDGDGS
jgi:hypothetical protein